MPVTLGISCFYHDAAAALLRDGEILAAAQEERFSRLKGDPSFPISAINYCLEEARLEVGDLDEVVFYDKPVLTLDRLLHSYLAVVPRGMRSWLEAMPRWLSQKLHIPRVIRDSLDWRGPVLFAPHHLSHAASAYYPSPFDDAAILTVDGVGEWATSAVGVGEGTELRLVEEMRFPNSLGLLYSAFTYFCGFKVNFGEYKLMGLAPYGEPSYLELIEDNIAAVEEDGTVALDLSCFSFLDGRQMSSERFDELFGGPRRQPESAIGRREVDLAASIQAFTEKAMLRMAEHVHRSTGKRRLCLAGGVALNCVANGRLLREGPFEELWIQPAAGDAGGALGAAYAVHHGRHGVARGPSRSADRQRGSLLGPAFSDQEIEAVLGAAGADYRRLQPSDRARTVAAAIADGRVVGFFQGRMEFGPRALGCRSILGDPRRADTQRVMNLRIKQRESFRPFAPSVLAEDAVDYFELDRPSPYMLLVAPVLERRRRPRSHARPRDDDLLAAASEQRSDIPAVTHWNYSARVQTVHRETNELYHQVISNFRELTGCSVVVNTSFNVRGEPIVCTPWDALRCFMRTDMDHLYLDGFWLDKEGQPEWQDDGDDDEPFLD